MRRHDYLALAQIIAAQRPEWPVDDPHLSDELAAVDAALNAVAQGLADYCGQNDPKFDRHRFLKNAGVAS